MSDRVAHDWITDLDADARALLRMDDDGWGGAAGWIAPAVGASRAKWGIPTGTVPGEREPGPQTRF